MTGNNYLSVKIIIHGRTVRGFSSSCHYIQGAEERRSEWRGGVLDIPGGAGQTGQTARMNGKEIPKHYHHFEGSMRENVDELLVRHRASVDALRAAVGDVLPTDEPHFYDDLFLMRFVMTHSKGGKECNLKVRIDGVCGCSGARAPQCIAAGGAVGSRCGSACAATHRTMLCCTHRTPKTLCARRSHGAKSMPKSSSESAKLAKLRTRTRA